MGKYFGTDGVRGVAGADLTCELAMKIGRGAAAVLTGSTGHRPRILIGKDTRQSGDMLEAALTAGLCSVGADVESLGVLPTPAVAYLVGRYNADAGIVISASHNPMEFNGIKIFNGDGFKLPDDIEDEIEAQVKNGGGECDDDIGRITRSEVAAIDYVEHVIRELDTDLSGLRVVFDCANGASSETARRIFGRLGCECIFTGAEPNGLNINDGVGSTHLDHLQALVLREKADIGVAFDGDADRCLLVDEKGGIIDGDKVLAVCGSDMKRRGKLSGGTIVATVMSNLGLHEFCRKNGVGLVCTSVGDRNVLEKMNECGYKLGGEQSGHTIFTDFSTTGDGQLTALQFLDVLSRSGKKASELASVCPQYPQVLLNVPVSHERGVKDAIMASDALAAAVALQEEKLSGEGRVLVRPSGTEALIRVMVEAKTEQIALLAAENLVNVIKML